ncbi:acyltransferase family protein [Insolitispirillum peregrinum]|uniref:Peptidoglycan/LPS O-acetylase OafA/YrhL, contains acyltransferase and SGNH-hydrolase domains n=1 Tax=Insolitispirillum peregrinum TaxID=80876 RepID=A0A1N7JCZ7_9PROT|nr:acyltransferase [Insolitispirillum peregrinum]SIS47198.1 Peptidoglycan/LPS O-acetylase OafA/YrhL, contains acyltransferase and SGNH-hydrolase domains [Insolitispirillum peregrinum]
MKYERYTGPERDVISDTNNMDMLRFFLAFSVMMVHMNRLIGDQSLSIFETFFNSGIAVDTFFILSGFLIIRSYESSSNLRSYIGKRIRRIYPGYGTVIFLSFLVGILISDLSFSEYLSSGSLKYLLHNLSFMNFLTPSLPGVFSHNTETAINGALWTIKVEVMFYLSVALIVWAIRRYGALKVIITLYILSVTYRLGLEHLGKLTLSKQLPGNLSYFMSGALIYYYFDIFKKIRLYTLLPAIALFLIFKQGDVGIVIQPLAIALVALAFVFVVYLGNFGRYGDFSYGIYIWHFPVIQALIWAGVFNNRLVGSVSTVTLTLVLAIISWHCIEKPFLRKNSHYRAVEK